MPIRGGKVLLARRAIDPHKGKFDTIGGFVDLSETLEAGALRETKEETGLAIQLLELLGNHPDEYDDESTLCFNYVAKIIGNTKPKPADDVASLEWVSINNPPLAEVGFKNTRLFLADLKKWYQRQKQT